MKFQSSPHPKTGRDPATLPTADILASFQSSPHPKTGRDFDLNGDNYVTQYVSILAPSEDRARHLGRRAIGIELEVSILAPSEDRARLAVTYRDHITEGVSILAPSEDRARRIRT